MGRGAAVYDLTSTDGRSDEPDVSPDMGDAAIADIPHFRNWESDPALVESGSSGVCRGRPEGQTY
eukprot:1321595-Alexandrium_andersonii.AAC.1